MRQTVLRQIARPDEHHQLHIDVPAEFGAQVEVIVLRIEEDIPTAANTTVLQAKGGFVHQVLADPAEDVWNEL